MQIPRSYVEGYSRVLNLASEQARGSLASALAQVDYTAPVADVREAVVAIMQQACGASTELSARLAADFYDELRTRFGIDDGYAAVADPMRTPEATEGAVRAFAQDMVDGKPTDQFVGKCLDRLDYEMRRAANECMAHNAKRDSRKPKWARVPVGSETCSFCIMLASRGFAYQSEDTASHAHANCDCRVIPSWDKSPIAQGYDPDRYYDMWKHPEKYADEKPERAKPEPRRQALTDRQKLEEEARRLYVANGGGAGLTPEQAAERFDLLVDGNTDAQLRKYIKRNGGTVPSTAKAKPKPKASPKPSPKPKAKPEQQGGKPATERQRLEEQARRIYLDRASENGLTRRQAEERFELLVKGNSDSELRKYIRRYGK